MNEFLNSFQKLEFDKIKNHIKRYATSDMAQERIDNLLPSSSLIDIRYNLSLVSEMKQLLVGDDALPLDNLPDVRSSLHRSSIENYILPSQELHKISLIFS